MRLDPSLRSGAYAAGGQAPGAPLTGQRLLDWYHVAVLGMAVLAIYANLPIYGYILYQALLPKFTFFGLFVLMLPLVLVKSRQLGAYLRSPFLLWAALMLVVNLVHMIGFSSTTDIGGAYLVDHQVEAMRSVVLTRVQYLLFALVLGYVAFTCTSRSYLYALVLLAIVIPGAVMLDFVKPGLLYPTDFPGAVMGRAGAMFINPNAAGEAMLLVLVFACSVTARKYRGALFLACAAGILTTFSRAAITGWVLLLLFLGFRKILPKSALATAAIVVGLAVVCLGSFEAYLQSRQEFEGASGNLLARLNFFSSFNLDDDSAEERASVVKAGWELFLQNPFFGAGSGATQFWSLRASTHNQLLLMAAEYGLFGVGLWAWLLVILARGRFFADRALQLAVAGLFAFLSMFTHLMLDGATYWLATCALVSIRQDGKPAPVDEESMR